MIKTVCMIFMVKKSKPLTSGTAPIYLRITLAGERIEFTTKRYIQPARLSATTQGMTGTTEEPRIFNLYLKTLEQEVFEAHRQLLEAKTIINARVLKNKLLGKEKIAEVKTLIPIFEGYQGDEGYGAGEGKISG